MPYGLLFRFLTHRIAWVAFLALACVLLWGIPSYGIWDPWELSAADAARSLLEGEERELSEPPLGIWLIAQSFKWFGIKEWSGRLPNVLFGFATLLLAYGFGSLTESRRRGVYCALVLGTSPLFLLNARHMMGEAIALFFSSAVFVLASLLSDPPSQRWKAPKAVIALTLGLALASVMAALAGGVLLAVLPPLLGVSGSLVGRFGFFGLWKSQENLWLRSIRLGIVGIAVLATLATAWAVVRDVEGYSFWTGGVPRGQAAPSFEVPIEALFHSFAPWSALLPLVFGWMGWRALSSKEGVKEKEEEGLLFALDLAALAWVGLAFLSQSIYIARYGQVGFLALFGLAWLIASFLRKGEEGAFVEYPARGLVVLLLSGLLFRDFRGYPSAPLNGLFLSSLSLPDSFHPSGGWAIGLGLFGLFAFLALSSKLSADPEPFFQALGTKNPKELFRAIAWPSRFLQDQWQRGLAFQVWIIFLGFCLAVAMGMGVVAVVMDLSIRGILSDDEKVLAVRGEIIRSVNGVGGVAAVLGGGGGLGLTLRRQSKRLWLFVLLALAGVAVGRRCFDFGPYRGKFTGDSDR
ncbi:MAG: glycosyltransferase family 39 protein [Sandaracinaceae bacterium]|nr:glycosyltransferase family 39 protein [Sandaracinaceae bacterium]